MKKEQIEKIQNIIDYLTTHNKNYTKQQYNYIMDLQELLQEEEKERPIKKRVFKQIDDDGRSKQGKTKTTL